MPPGVTTLLAADRAARLRAASDHRRTRRDLCLDSFAWARPWSARVRRCCEAVPARLSAAAAAEAEPARADALV